MEIDISPSFTIIIMQLLALIKIGAGIYLWFLIIKALRIYIKKNS